MTWLQLWKRISVQPIKIAQNKNVTVVLKDGTKYNCKLIFTNNGNDFHLETEDYVR